MAKKQIEKVNTRAALDGIWANFEAEMLWRMRACTLLELASTLPAEKFESLRAEMKAHADAGLDL